MDESLHIWNRNSDVHVSDTLKVHMRPHLTGEWDNDQDEYYLAGEVEMGSMTASVHHLYCTDVEVEPGNHLADAYQQVGQILQKN